MTGCFLNGMGEPSLPVCVTGVLSSGKRDAPDPCCPERGPPQHSDSHSLRLPWSPYLILFRGCCILLSAQKHPAVCNETRDERHTFSPYWLTVLSKEDEKAQTEWALSLLSSSRRLPDSVTHTLLPRSFLETLFKLSNCLFENGNDFSCKGILNNHQACFWSFPLPKRQPSRARCIASENPIAIVCCFLKTADATLIGPSTIQIEFQARIFFFFFFF